ncbi:SDR family oxidoreductase [Kitasatospora sp. NPDC087314]|uniref:SDR family oxidoreductase n=1 Tax=Kitasatospora sp. NPDC087314 TaxID=3364068 RepID=UPI00382EFA7B
MNTAGRLAGRSALITGGAGAVGADIARRLGAEGAAVALGHHDGAERAERLAAALEEAGGRATAIRADLTAPDGAVLLVEAAATAFGGLDIVVNSAAVTHWRPLERTPLEDIDHVLGLDARAPYLVMQAAAARLPAGGRIINLSSDLASRALPGSSLFSASMAFVEQVTRVASAELADRRITVNAVAYGPETTGLAAMVALLASPEAAEITGQVINLTGNAS